MTDPKRVVADGYDAIAQRYGEWAASFETPVGSWLARLIERLDPGSRVLDLGCGNGSIVTRPLVEAGHDVTGVDISGAQIELARRNAPKARLVLAAATEVELPLESLDAVVAAFLLGHVPRAEQLPLLARIHAWLRPGGWTLLTMGIGDSADVVDDWLGAPMFFASFDEQTNRNLIARAGFDLQDARVVPFDEPGHGRVSFMWVLARRPL